MSINQVNSAARPTEVASQVLLGASIITAIALAILTRCNVSAVQQHLNTAFSVTGGAAAASLGALIISKHQKNKETEVEGELVIPKHQKNKETEVEEEPSTIPDDWTEPLKRAETGALGSNHPIAVRGDGTELTAICLGSSRKIIQEAAKFLGCSHAYGCLLTPTQYQAEEEHLEVFTAFSADEDVGDGFFPHPTAYFTDMESSADQLVAPLSSEDVVSIPAGLRTPSDQLRLIRTRDKGLAIAAGEQHCTNMIVELDKVEQLEALGEQLRESGEQISALAWVDASVLYYIHVNDGECCYLPLTLEQAKVAIKKL